MKLKYYTRRREHENYCEIEKTSDGWAINASGLTTESGESDSYGKPSLFAILNHDSVNYPEELGGYMDYLWRQSEEKSMDNDEIQDHLNMLGEWISIVEKNSPTGIFQYFK